MAAGLVTVDGAVIVVTESGRSVAAPGRGGLFSQIDVVLRRLRRLDVPAPTDWRPPAGAWAAAVQEYLDRDRH